MIQLFHRMISATLSISEKQIGHTLDLLADGATIPFISRYRKEVTGGLDEVQIEAIKTQYEKLNELAKRKETIVNTINEQGKMTPELQKRIDETWDSTILEDIYLPYKPKRRTRAEVARQKRSGTLGNTTDVAAGTEPGEARRSIRQRRSERCGRCIERSTGYHCRTGQ